jgi:hypothetical protein
VSQRPKWQRCIDTEGLARGLTELRTGKHGAIIGEAARPWSKAASHSAEESVVQFTAGSRRPSGRCCLRMTLRSVRRH